MILFDVKDYVSLKADLEGEDFLVVSIDEENKTVTLKDDNGSTFDVEIDDVCVSTFYPIPDRCAECILSYDESILDAIDFINCDDEPFELPIEMNQKHLLKALDRIYNEAIPLYTGMAEYFNFIDELIDSDIPLEFKSTNRYMLQLDEIYEEFRLRYAKNRGLSDNDYNEIRQMLLNYSKSYYECELTLFEHKRIAVYFSENSEEDYTDEELELYKKTLEYLVSINDGVGLRIYGYEHYGDDGLVYSCDWNVARDSLIKAIETGELSDLENAYICNTLGYIYYYGRCNNGVMETDLAFKYFSISAAAKIDEGIFKLSDVMMKAKGVLHNEYAAVKNLYPRFLELKREYLTTDYDNNFADFALRIAGFSERGIACKKDNDLALMHYLMADMALKRRQRFKYYGDQSLRKSVSSSIRRLLSSGEFITNVDKCDFTNNLNEVCNMINSLLEVNHGVLDCEIKRHKNKTATITISGENPAMIYYYHYAKLEITDELVFTITNPSFYENDFIFRKAFYSEGKLIFTMNDYMDLDLGDEDDFIDEEGFTNEVKFTSITAKIDTVVVDFGTTIHRFVTVEFTKGGKKYDYLCDDFDVLEHDRVKIEGHDEELVVLKVKHQKESDCRIPIDKYKKVVEVIKVN